MLGEYKNIPVESQTWEFKLNRLPEDETVIEIWDDGYVAICLSNDSDILISVDDLAEIVRRAKMFKDRRTAYLERKNNDDNA